MSTRAEREHADTSTRAEREQAYGGYRTDGRHKTRIKLCGLTRPEDVAAANGLRPDYAGFVFAPSRRRVAEDTARGLIAQLDAAIVPVGVFVDEAPDTIARIARMCRLGVVQLHGSEGAAEISTLRALLPAETAIWKALRVRDAASLAPLRDLTADRFLLDAWHPEQAGGTGEAFDWRILADVSVPYLLAGGLHAGNVADAIRLVRPWGVDVSSGVETEGRKDPERMAAFMAAVRGQDAVG